MNQKFEQGLVVFSGTGCSSCQALKSKLSAKGITFNEFNIWEDPEALTFMSSQGFRTIPQVFKDGTHLTEEQIAEVLAA